MLQPKTILQLLISCVCLWALAARAATPTYADVHSILAKNCLACHDSKEAEGGLVLETYDLLLAGGDSGAAIVPGKSAESLLIKVIERTEKPFMPPPKKAEKLKPAEIATLRAWIDAGAPKPTATELAATTQRALAHVAPTVSPRRAVQSLTFSPKANLLAVARASEVELRAPDTRQIVRVLQGHHGNVNELAFTSDGKTLFAAAGEPGKAGEVRAWSVADGKLLFTLAGHTDAIYALALSADDKLLATGSYDQKILLWDVASHARLRELEGHNGAVFSLAFRKDGKVLASGSADRTVKLWSVADGRRLDTRPESLKDQQTIAFSPDGQRLYSAGVDNRVRIWQIGATAAEGTNPLLDAVFAHEGAILRLAFSPDGKLIATSADDRTVKLWSAADFSQKLTLSLQPDWPSALAFTSVKTLAVGRLDGTIAFYDVATGKEVPPAMPKPPVAKSKKPAAPGTLLTDVHPRAVQRGTTRIVRLLGSDPEAIASVKSSSPKVTLKLVPTTQPASAFAEVSIAPDAPIGAVDLVAVGFAGETQAQKLVIDELPVVPSSGDNHSIDKPSAAHSLPVTFVGEFGMRGQADYFAFDAQAGQHIVLDAAARRVGSKATVVMWLLDSAGRTLATGDDIDGDPILEATLPAAGRYYIRTAEQIGTASSEHFYTVAVGDLHVVTGAFPFAGPPKKSVMTKLLGYNLPEGRDARSQVDVPETGDAPVLVDATKFRIRRQPMISAGYAEEQFQGKAPREPIDLTLPGAANAAIDTPGASGVYRFHATAGQTLVLETLAARRGSPLDTKIEVLWPDGKPVLRAQLRAVRDSWLNFRPVDGNSPATRLANWEEMDLNQFVYLNGEVVKLFRMPRGPDSDLLFFSSNGRRRNYFDTSATSHALDDKAYIVEPHAPGETLAPNGLPVFSVYYQNDDDEMRQIAPDSRLLFNAPKDGDYLVRVTDVRGFGGDRYVYRLIARPAAPDFNVSLVGVPATVAPGTGRDFTVRVDRIDGFDGPIRVDITGTPPGWQISTPIVIEAGHLEAKGTVFAAADTKSQDPKAAVAKATAAATVGGQSVTKPAADLPRLTVAGPAPMNVQFEPYADGNAGTKPSTIELIPGQMTKAWIRVQRLTHKDRVTFEVENLPFGVIVADIGLNGVLIPPDQSERLVFLQCAPWVQETTRLCHARANEAGNPTSAPIAVHVATRRLEAAR